MNIKYKLSKYNIQKENNGIIKVYNTYTNKCFEYPKVIYDRLISIALKHETPLLDAGIVVPIDLNEKQRVIDEAYETCFNYDTLSLVIAPTMSCCYNCKYCFEYDNLCQDAFMSIKTMNDTVEFIKQQVEKHKGTVKRIKIKWFGGEPLLQKEAIKYLTDEIIEKVLKPYHLMYKATMYSNCRLLTEETAIMLKECNISNVTVTIDGLKATYVLQKGCTDKDYDITLENIKRTEKILPRITVAINVAKVNKDEVIDTIKYLRDHGINSNIYLNRMICYTEESTENNDITYDEFKNVCDSVANIANVITPSLFSRRKCTCEASLDYHYVIGHDGHIYRCEHLLNMKEHSIGTVKDGIHNKPVKPDIWVNNHIPEKCLECPIFPICNLNACTTNSLMYQINMDCEQRIQNTINKM